MIRKFLVLLSAFAFIAMGGYAQTPVCGTDIMHYKFLQEHPEMAQKIADDAAKLEQWTKAQIKVMDINKLARTTIDTANPNILTDTLFIPVVVHIIHNYGAEDVTDNNVYQMIATLNTYYQLKNDTSGVIPIFKKFVGRPNVYFKLATKDPQGNPTKGITRHYTYATYGGDNGAKYDLWSPTTYMNIWIENVIGLAAGEPGAVVAAYSQLPPDGAADPFIDGLITASPFINDGSESYVIAHEVGHYLNLLHPFGTNNNGVEVGHICGDDEVDDTPPTTGEFDITNCPAALYDTGCAVGYVKLYPSSVPGVDSIYDYPDTANVQNIMTYSPCTPELMFSKGQSIRMRAALNNDIAGRNNLWTPANLAKTGALDPVPDLPVVPDYAVSGTTSSTNSGIASTVFNGALVCQNQTINFINKSWNDTVQTTKWNFSNGATPATSSATTQVTGVVFTQPGWVTVSMDVTGNNTATQTLVDSQKVFVVDANPTNGVGYYQEFNQGGDLAKWPSFNYYNNGFKWKLNNNVGYYDNTSIEYTGYDTRLYPDSLLGPVYIPASHAGDYDDLFTPSFDLTGVKNGADSVYLSFMYSGAARSGVAQNINDTLEITYNLSCGSIWKSLAVLTKTKLANQGSIATPYQPGWMGQWDIQNIALPAAALTSGTIFRFRYKPRSNAAGTSTGNNFYMDRIHFATHRDQLDVNNVLPAKGMNVMLAPNPTKGSTYVIISDVENAMINVQVTDITGKVVYTTQQRNTGAASHIEIPQAAISVKGVYLVHVSSDSQVHTEKLVVY